MKGRFAPILVLCLLSLATSPWATAQEEGPLARGSFQFLLEDEQMRYVEFEARTDREGITRGQMTFVDQSRIPDVEDDEGSEPPRDAPPELYIKAALNGLVIEKNRAVMSGMVLDSSHRIYIGKWVQLVVEDSREVPDHLTWQFCRPRGAGWVPSDAERKDDDGAYLRWWATDAERKDDVGIPSPNLLPGEDNGCLVHPLQTYSFPTLLKWEGDIVVQP